MWKRLLLTVALLVAVGMATEALDKSWLAILLPLIILLVCGWYATSLLELALLPLCVGATYLLFLLANGQLLAKPDPVDGGYFVVALYALELAFISLIGAGAGWVAKRVWKRAA